MKEGKDHDSIVVFLGYGHKIQIIMLMEVEYVVLFVFDDRLQSVLIVFQNLFIENIIDISRNIRPKVPGNQYSAFFIKNIES